MGGGNGEGLIRGVHLEGIYSICPLHHFSLSTTKTLSLSRYLIEMDSSFSFLYLTFSKGIKYYNIIHFVSYIVS